METHIIHMLFKMLIYFPVCVGLHVLTCIKQAGQ